MSSTNISGASSQIYVKNDNKEIEKNPETTKTDQKSGNDEEAITKQTEAKSETPVEQNKIQNFNKSNSEPKLLDFGIFDYKLDNARKQNEDKKDLEPINNKDKIDSNGNELKDLIDKITNSPDMQKELKNLTESFGNIGEALNHMAPGHIPYNGAIHSSDGDVGTEFFKKLQNIINSSH